MFEKTQLSGTLTPPTSTKLPQTSTKLQHFAAGLLNVADAAKLLNKPPMTVTRWCQSGRLPAFEKPFGTKTTYLISPLAIEMLKAELQQTKAPKAVVGKSQQMTQAGMIPAWLSAMESGTLTGKAYSPLTVQDYEGFVGDFVAKYQTVSYQTLHDALEECGGKYARRFKLFKAVVCFAKFLHREGQLAGEFFHEVKPLFPKRHREPKRVTVSESELLKLLEHCNKPVETALIVLLSSTGLRASELCNLQVTDVELEKQTFTAKHRKAGKMTGLGLNVMAVSAIKAYRDSLPSSTDSAFMFLDEEGHPFTRMAVYHRLKRLGERAGVPVHPHALRRAFVTINANKGRPLQMLQLACGHSSIKTTMDYCRTSEEEVINAMKDW